MGYGIRLLVSGDYACFTRPEMKAERVSYDVITPSAARGIIEAVYWHPGLKWVVDKLTVLNEIKFDSVRRNELASKISLKKVNQAMRDNNSDLYQNINYKTKGFSERQQRATLLLCDVAYIIDAHFELIKDKMSPTDNIGKFLDQFNRRARRGQCYYQPYLGCREFSAHFKLIEESDAVPSSFYEPIEFQDLGWMLWDMEYEAINEETKTYEYTPKFFRAAMHHGVIDASKAVMT